MAGKTVADKLRDQITGLKQTIQGLENEKRNLERKSQEFDLTIKRRNEEIAKWKRLAANKETKIELLEAKIQLKDQIIQTGKDHLEIIETLAEKVDC